MVAVMVASPLNSGYAITESPWWHQAAGSWACTSISWRPRAGSPGRQARRIEFGGAETGRVTTNQTCISCAVGGDDGQTLSLCTPATERTVTT